MSGDDGSLLIETMSRERELAMIGNTPVCNPEVLPGQKSCAVLSDLVQKKPGDDIQVCEVDGEVDPNMLVSDDYLVHLPSPDCDVDIIPTPPLAPEGTLRFNQRMVDAGQDLVCARAAKQAKKRNL